MSRRDNLARLPGRHHLFVPGPTNVPDRVLRAMSHAMEDHRSSGFPALALSLFGDLGRLMRSSDGRVFIFPSSGTGGWEAALTNTCSPGDRLLAVRNGHFSHLFVDCAERHGLRVEAIDVEWGEAAPPERIEAALAADTDARSWA